ncbi:efflux RND transporter periplasmic adaptor subunit [Stenotrophomonas ginsengisoli]|uniref:efflux RND transporter periplasmic adaptor subunit n=1 Tax=Stenotrophomonas ginsengisoli TaxID=336566 RepID=UPI000B08EDB7
MKLPLPKSRSARVALAVAVIAAIGGGYYWFTRGEAAPQLATAAVVRGDLEQTVDATGVIDAYQLVNVGAQASGQIKKLYVELGDEVKAGDLIAEIDSTTQTNSLTNAEAAMENIQAQRSVQLANLREAELAFDRQKMMYAEQASSKAEYDSAEAKLATTRAQIRALDAQVKQRQAELQTARANLGYTRITAPIDGTVVAVVAEEGRTVNANQSAPTIVKLAKLDTVTVNAEISEADVVKVKPGMPVYFTILGNSEHKYHATLRVVNPAPASIANESSSSASSSSSSSAVYYNALFDVENPDGTLRIDMTAQVSVLLQQAKDALLIPSVALGPKMGEGRGQHQAGAAADNSAGDDASAQGQRPADGQGRQASGRGPRPDGAPGGQRPARRDDCTAYMVRVVGADGQPAPKPVCIGLNNGSMAQVVDGLAEGDKVVVGEVTDAERAAAGSRNNMRGGPMMMGGPRR